MDITSSVQALSALAQSTRLHTFRLLTQHELSGMAAGDIARTLAIPQNTLSTHLAILSQAGLIKATRCSRSIVYRANLDRIRELTLFLLKDCCHGRAEICAPLMADLASCC